jgi:hypothetical protein
VRSTGKTCLEVILVVLRVLGVNDKLDSPRRECKSHSSYLSFLTEVFFSRRIRVSFVPNFLFKALFQSLFWRGGPEK